MRERGAGDQLTIEMLACRVSPGVCFSLRSGMGVTHPMQSQSQRGGADSIGLPCPSRYDCAALVTLPSMWSALTPPFPFLTGVATNAAPLSGIAALLHVGC
jgi:hypothetical protein